MPYPGTIITDDAFSIIKAASSALPILTALSLLIWITSASLSLPKPPNMTLKKLQFIALYIMYDKIAPDDPTSEPVTIITLLPNVNPIPHAAQPEYEFNIDITTGISAPPIGMMIRIPIRNDKPRIDQNAISDCSKTVQKINAISVTARIALTRCWHRKVRGAPEITP
jgi:hypothetical protein